MTVQEFRASLQTTTDIQGAAQSGSLPFHEQPSEDGEFSLRQVLKEPELRRGFLSIISTLTIGIMGGAVLPVAWAFSVTGIFVGVVIMTVVSLANVYTSDLLLRQSYKCGASTYESLAFKVGGRWWKLTTEISIVILMMGTLVGGIQQVGEVGSKGVLSIWPNSPGWLVNGSGRSIMALGTVFIVAPLCMVKQLRQLEYAGVLGTCIVLCLVATVVIESSTDNLPAIKHHQFSNWGFSTLGDVSQAVSIFGFAFYIQPIMMPLLQEMPPGRAGAKVISWGNRVVVLVNAFLIYLLVGLFGAAKFGNETQENILQNIWLGGGVAQGVLNLSMAFYLALANPLSGFPLYITIEGWIPGNREKHKRMRQFGITTLVLVVSLGVAEAFPNSSGKVLTATGASGVCLVSYLIPVVNHLLMFFGRARCQRDAAFWAQGKQASVNHVPGNDALVAKTETIYYQSLLSYRRPVGPGRQAWTWEMVSEVGKPLLVLSVGAFCSVSALSTIRQQD